MRLPLDYRLTAVRLQQASAADWDYYIKATTKLPDGEEYPVYAHFKGPEDEGLFRKSWTDEDVQITGVGVKHILGIGLLVEKIQNWILLPKNT